ncbi:MULTISPECIES: MarR family winged helix-turn-helix transcriptional regulator [Bacillus cereus group]|uniref:MarR family winged helix-turn-helix transcriptional regulator n=1 Tax=Bacillus cereus group TaxID=86661 RepID=UPI000B489F9A|nr:MULTISPECIES: MarR family transcriptional regulator [Bacillus cereus group]MEB9627224.1 MarR family transcriptional regulator [Bacillus anthracis]OUA98248.1 MarR family transcriptional regulator [Bacillus thuringiensis serovar oswaldocruzi]
MITKKINKAWTDIYYSLHYDYKEVLTHQNIRFLQTINKNDNVTIQFLSKMINISHNTASEHVQRLEKKGYIKKNKSPHDERQVFVTLTEVGERVLQQNTELDEKKLVEVFNTLSIEDQQKVIWAFTLMGESSKKRFGK